MYSNEEKEQIIRLLNVCKGLIDAEPYVYQDGSAYGIEYEGYQTLKITIEPVFDMSEHEISALVNLMARVLPIAHSLFEEGNRKDAKIEALMDCIATISVIGSERMQRISGIEIIQDDAPEEQTVGEK